MPGRFVRGWAVAYWATYKFKKILIDDGSKTFPAGCVSITVQVTSGSADVTFTEDGSTALHIEDNEPAFEAGVDSGMVFGEFTVAAPGASAVVVVVCHSGVVLPASD